MSTEPDNSMQPELTSDKRLASSSLIMAAGTFVSRALGQLRSIVLIFALGATGIAAEAFNAANTIPNNLNNIIAGGLLNAILVPQLVRAARRRDGGQEYTNKLLTVSGVILLALTVLMTIGASVLTLIFVDVTPEARALTTALAFWCIPEMFFYGLYTLLGQVLNARGNFGPYMWAPVLNNIISIIGFGIFIFMFGPHQRGLEWSTSMTIVLGATALLGIAAQALVLIIPLKRSGFSYRPQWGIRGMGFSAAGKMAWWTFLGIVVTQIGFIFISRGSTAAQAVTGNDPTVAGFSAYTYAFMIFMLPHSLITVSIVTAVFTRLSAHAADERIGEVRRDFSLTVRMVAIFTIFATAVMALLAYPLTRSLYPTVAPVSVGAISNVIVAMSFGLVAFGVWSVGQRVFYAFENARLLFYIQIPMTIVVILGCLISQWTLDARNWVVGIALATTVSYILGAIIVLFCATKPLESIDGHRILRLVVRATLAVLVSVGIGKLVLMVFGDLSAPGWIQGWLYNVFAVIVVGLAMLASYVFMLRVFRVEEIRIVTSFIRRRLPSKNSSSS